MLKHKPLKELKAVEIMGKTKIAVTPEEGASLIGLSIAKFKTDIQPYITPYKFGESKNSATRFLVSDIIEEFMKHGREKSSAI